MTGRCCELAARGYSRDGKKGCAQIEYGLLTDPAGRPVAVRVFPGNTADPTAFTEIVAAMRDTFALDNLVLVGDRGMITTARITALRELNEAGTGFGWITALRAPQIAKLAADDGPLQMSLFDTHDLAEIATPTTPGERLIACRNPALAVERARKRDDCSTPPRTLWPASPSECRRPAGRSRRIGEAVGKVIGKYKVGKHFHRTITDTSLTYQPADHDHIAAEAALDGIYVLRTIGRRRRARPGRDRHRLQEPRQRRTRLPHPQGRRPGPTAHPPPPRRPRQSPRAYLHDGGGPFRSAAAGFRFGRALRPWCHFVNAWEIWIFQLPSG